MAKRRIVIGFDGSPQGEDALVLGRTLGEALDAAATVAIVAHYPPRHTPEGEELDASLAEFCEPLFATARDRLDGLPLREQPMVNGSVGRALTGLVDELDPVLMVIGSARHGQLGEVLLGGVGGSLLSGCNCSIAVAPLGFADGKRQLDRIGAGVDGTPQSLRALGAAAVLAESAKVPVRVMTVEEPHHYALGGALSPLNPEEYERYKEEEAQGVLDEAVENVPDGVSAEPRLLHGPAAEALAEASRDLDLLVVGSRAYGPAKGALLGSVSSKLIKSLPCAVLVVPRGSGPQPLAE